MTLTPSPTRLLEVAGRLAPQSSLAGGAAETARALLCTALSSCTSSEDVDAAMAAAAQVIPNPNPNPNQVILTLTLTLTLTR